MLQIIYFILFGNQMSDSNSSTLAQTDLRLLRWHKKGQRPW